MTIEITIQVSDRLGKELEPYRRRLPELLERGLREMAVEPSRDFGDAGSIVDILAGRPSPETVLALQPSPELQARASTLLARSKDGALSGQEELELERYLTLEHVVRLAKARAFEDLAQAT